MQTTSAVRRLQSSDTKAKNIIVRNYCNESVNTEHYVQKIQAQIAK